MKEVFLPSDRATGRPRGFAIVELADGAAAAKAIEELDETELKGRSIRLSEARERAPRTSFTPGGGPPRGGGGAPRPGGAGKPKGSRRNLRGRKRSL